MGARRSVAFKRSDGVDVVPSTEAGRWVFDSTFIGPTGVRAGVRELMKERLGRVASNVFGLLEFYVCFIGRRVLIFLGMME
jgi:hypothetical protein